MQGKSGDVEIEHFDVLVLGAGISGISAAYHIKSRCKDRSFAILEGRAAAGGTWDLFRYPGVRSDSDMHTLGFSFRPWTGEKAIANGASILQYVRDAIKDSDLESHIRYAHKAVAASWSTHNARWTVQIEHGPDKETRWLTCNFLFSCTGYYNYAKGHVPEFAGSDDFAGQIVQPQFWPQEIDYQNKRIVVVGSGATAITIVPAMAKSATHVTMLQRSPSYVVNRPSVDGIANWLRRWLPAKMAYGLTRWKNVLIAMYFYTAARSKPDKARAAIIDMVRNEVGNAVDVETHFSPRYNPWDQRLCFVPDSDLFAALRDGRASIITDEIETFTHKGLILKSGATLEADIVVLATGLSVQLMSDIKLEVDGVPANPAHSTSYKGMMYSDIPNLASTFGYTNVSWTLRADLTSVYICRLLNRMQREGARICTPRKGSDPLDESAFISLSSGYVTRALEKLPKQGSRDPWRTRQNFLIENFTLKLGNIDAEMEFSNPQHLPEAVT
jgi:monooxygenase